MTTFQQICPGCKRALELPADSKGRLGKCPACDVTFTIGAEPVASADSLAAATPDDTDANPLEDREQEFESQPRIASRAETLQVTACEIEDVLTMTLSIFRARFWGSTLPFVVAVFAAALVVALPLYVLGEAYANGSKKLAIFGLILVSPFSFVCSVQLWLFLARAQLSVARNEDASIYESMPPVNIFLRGLGVGLLFFLGAGIAFVVMYSLIAMTGATGAVVMERILKIVALFTIVALWFGLVWYSWSWLFVCGDGKGTAIGSMRAALAITQENKLTSFFLVLIAVVLSLAGTLTCLVGHFVTAPLTLLMFAVAYLIMTGQQAADPTRPIESQFVS